MVMPVGDSSSLSLSSIRSASFIELSLFVWFFTASTIIGLFRALSAVCVHGTSGSAGA
jgi:hypothetical protein